VRKPGKQLDEEGVTHIDDEHDGETPCIGLEIGLEVLGHKPAARQDRGVRTRKGEDDEKEAHAEVPQALRLDEGGEVDEDGEDEALRDPGPAELGENGKRAAAESDAECSEERLVPACADG